MVRSPKIDRWSSRSHIRERTLQDCLKRLGKKLLVWRHSIKLLLDECIDRKLSREFPGYEVKTVRQMTSSADWLAIVYFWIGQISKANSFR